MDGSNPCLSLLQLCRFTLPDSGTENGIRRCTISHASQLAGLNSAESGSRHISCEIKFGVPGTCICRQEMHDFTCSLNKQAHCADERKTALQSPPIARIQLPKTFRVFERKYLNILHLINCAVCLVKTWRNYAT